MPWGVSKFVFLDGWASPRVVGHDHDVCWSWSGRGRSSVGRDQVRPLVCWSCVGHELFVLGN